MPGPTCLSLRAFSHHQVLLYSSRQHGVYNLWEDPEAWMDRSWCVNIPVPLSLGWGSSEMHVWYHIPEFISGLSSFTLSSELLEKYIIPYFLSPSFSCSLLLCQQYRDHLPNKQLSHSNLCTRFCFWGRNPTESTSFTILCRFRILQIS